MKMLTLSLLSLAFVAHAHAMTETARLNKFNFAEGSSLAAMTIEKGTVVIGAEKSQIVVTLYPTSVCKAGETCILLKPGPIHYRAAMTSIRPGVCDTAVYTALTDERQMDGLRVEITVTDHATDFCKYLVAVPKTEVVLNIQGYFPNRAETHLLGGDILDRQN